MDYKIPKNKYSFDDICHPKKYKLQIPQMFLSNYLGPKSDNKRLLIYHKIGSGKTCTAIQICEAWKNKKKIMVVLPASLQGNFVNEIRSLCTGDTYMSDKDRNELKNLLPSDERYIDIVNNANKKIKKIYTIYSYNKFVKLIEMKALSIDNTLLIIDEIQNMISEIGKYYINLLNFINNAPADLRIVLLTATPIFDKPNEIALTLNLLKPENPLPTGNKFNEKFISEKGKIINRSLFKSYIKGYISYYKGAPEFTFPHLKIKYLKCEMDTFQYSIYKKIETKELQNDYSNNDENVLKLPNNFYIGTRLTSNIVFPNKKISDSGLKSLSDNHIKNKLFMYSAKFYKMMEKILRSSGKIFIYSAFKNYGGITSIIKILESFGYKNYDENGIGKNRFAIWSGDETNQYKDQIKNEYNHITNLYGENIKILIGSLAIKEGVSLTAVRHAHILEPYWNMARLQQIIGRASRYCSHKDLPEEKRFVKVYIYIAVHPDAKQTIDEYILNMAITKNKLIQQFEKLMQESAIDCKLNINANNDENDPIICDEIN